MKVIDIHVHVEGTITPQQVEEFLEQSKLAGTVLLSRNPTGMEDGGKRSIEELAEVRRKIGDRVFPFAYLDPAHPQAPRLLEYAVRQCGFVGLKMLPQTFHPADVCARTMYEVAGKLNVPLIMHTGILWLPGNNTNNCRPGNMDVMWDYPQTRFAMAHIGWPWTDECIAQAQKLRTLRGDVDQAFVDLTPGTPPSYRHDALAKCIENVHADFMLFGSDCFLPEEKHAPRWLRDKEIFDRLAVPESDQEKIFHRNALRFISGSGRSA